MNNQRTQITRLVAAGLMIGAMMAFGTVACNDDGESLTLEEYFLRVDEIDNSSTERIDANFATITDESDIDQFRNAFKGFAPILDDVTGDFDDLNPPDAAKEKHDAMASALNAFSDKVTELADGVDEIDATTPDEFFGALGEQGFTEVEEAFTAACLDLQQLATDNSIDIELDCADDEEEGSAGSDDAAAMEQTVRDAIAAWNGKDAEAFLELWSDEGLSAVFSQDEPATREDVAAFLPEIIGDPPLELRELTVEGGGDSGTVQVIWVSSPFLEQIDLDMVNEDGAWKVNGQDYVDVDDVPDGTTVVEVQVNEFAFGVIADDVIAANASSPVAFTIENVGEQTHHFGLFQLPAEGDIQTFPMSEEEVPWLDVVGFTDDIAPGETNSAFVFVEQMPPGRYAMVCFLPDTSAGPDGPPHAFQGMVQEFIIPEPAASLAPEGMSPRM